ncbi:MAG TPA: response regulator, partial [Bacillota bacterium]|nr:response regulator [Bacillota bacterium]
MEAKLKILHIEDEPTDSELIGALLRREGLSAEIDRVETMAGVTEALERGGYGLILSDHTIPGMDSLEALRLARERRPEVPFVFVSGTLGEEVAVETLKRGATDYVLKQRLNRLVPAVRRALQEAEEQAGRTRFHAEQELCRVKAANEATLAQLRAIIGSMTEGLVVFDPQGNLLDMNPAGLAIHGFDSAQDLQQHLRELGQVFELRDLEGNLLPLEQWPISRALRGETFTGYQVQVRRLDGSREWFASYSGAPVRNPQGQMVLGIVTFHDITELRRAEAALGRRVEQQEILSQALAQLLSTDDPKELVRELFPQVAAHLGVDTFF